MMLCLPSMNTVCASTYVCLPQFLQCHVVSEYRSSTSLVKFIPRYLIFVVVAIVNGIVFLISFSDIARRARETKEKLIK